jgi:membrane-associated phospholipid phosphatase
MGYRSLVRSFEWVACSYFLYLAVAGWLPRISMARRALLMTAAAAAGGIVVAIARSDITWLRDVAPMAYILVGYFLSGYLFASPSIATESWLMQWDRRLLGDPATRFANWPRVLVAALELIYMSCFLLIPAGLALLAFTGHAARIDRYWTMVVASEFAAFAPLAVIQTRPPWVLERKPQLADKAVHHLATQMVEHLSIRVNTFPSGHAAGSLAVALGVIGALPLAGTVLLGLAIGICVGCVVGRYHYLIDVVAGVAVALGVWLVN